MGALNKIEHIVVLMLENRSFDCMLGKLYAPSPGFDGLTGNEFNVDARGEQIKVWNKPGTDDVAMSIPTPDPGELWLDINTQLFGSSNVPMPPTPTMGGFVNSYIAQAAANAGVYDPPNVMHYYTPEQLPVLSKLARQFAVSDRWFASAPCQTWPNRFFVHTGTAAGYQNNSPTHFPYEMETIFNRFELAGNDNWKIYFHDIAQSKTLTDLWLLADHFHFYDSFRVDAMKGTLPAYSFIEPRYFTDWLMPNDQHPPHVVTLGEQLIAEVYNSLRSGPAWTKTLLIITYDEHGGCYDHVAPPAATPPSLLASAPFNFDRYGVRVPAVIVSPYIRQATVARPTGNVPYDHTSVLATLRKRFPELGPPLTRRDAVAPDLDSILGLETPTNLGPQRIDPLPHTTSPTTVAYLQDYPLNGMQKALVELAAHLPSSAMGADADTIANHIKGIPLAPRQPPPEALTNLQDAAAYIKKQLGDFFRSAT